MSHWAEIDETGLVLRVLVGDNNEPDEGQAFMESLGGTWVKTSYNSNIRKNYAGIGMYYDEGRDAFIEQQPFTSWVLNEDTCRWEAPTPIPVEEGKLFTWDEATLSWVELTA